MTAVALHHDSQAIAVATAVLDRLRERSASLLYGAVLTDDGFEVHSVRAGATADGNRFASIASSLQALGEAAARELLTPTGSPTVLVFSDAGHIVQVRAGRSTLVLAALFSSDETVGHALASSRVAANELDAGFLRV